MTTTPSSFLTIPERLPLSDAEMIRSILWQFSCALRVAAPGIIQTFDAAKQTATVRIAILENISKNVPDNQGSSVPTSSQLPIPVLVDVPVVLPRGGGFTLTMPLKAGDECWLVFGDNCFSAWWATGGQPTQGGNGSHDKTAFQERRRRHNLNDAVCIPGPWSQPRVLSNYSTTAAQLRSDDGQTLVEVGSGEVTIQAVNVTIKGSSSVKVGDGSETKHVAFIEDVVSIFNAHVHSGVTSGTSSTGVPTTTLANSNGTSVLVAD